MELRDNMHNLLSTDAYITALLSSSHSSSAPLPPKPSTNSSMVETLPHDMHHHTKDVHSTTTTPNSDFELLATVLARDHKTTTKKGHNQAIDGQRLTSKNTLYKNDMRPIVEYCIPTPSKRKASGLAASPNSEAATKLTKTTVDIYFPIETIKLRYKNRNPWITQELKNDIKIRDRLYIILKNNPTPENIIILKIINLTKQRKAERDYYREQFEIHQHDLKKSWSNEKISLAKKTNIQLKTPTIFLINNQYTTDRQTISNTFNDYFINVGNSLAKNKNSDVNLMLYVQYYDKSIDMPEINTAEIISVITSLSYSAAGYDEIPASIMKQLIVYYVQPLTSLINKSIAQGKFPNELKLANVLPIHTKMKMNK